MRFFGPQKWTAHRRKLQLRENVNQKMREQQNFFMSRRPPEPNIHQAKNCGRRQYYRSEKKSCQHLRNFFKKTKTEGAYNIIPWFDEYWAWVDAGS